MMFFKLFYTNHQIIVLAKEMSVCLSFETLMSRKRLDLGMWCNNYLNLVKLIDLF